MIPQKTSFSSLSKIIQIKTAFDYLVVSAKIPVCILHQAPMSNGIRIRELAREIDSLAGSILSVASNGGLNSSAPNLVASSSSDIAPIDSIAYLFSKKNPIIEKIRFKFSTGIAEYINNFNLVLVYEENFQYIKKTIPLSSFMVPNQTSRDIVDIPIGKNYPNCFYFLVGSFDISFDMEDGYNILSTFFLS